MTSPGPTRAHALIALIRQLLRGAPTTRGRQTLITAITAITAITIAA